MNNIMPIKIIKKIGYKRGHQSKQRPKKPMNYVKYEVVCREAFKKKAQVLR